MIRFFEFVKRSVSIIRTILGTAFYIKIAVLMSKNLLRRYSAEMLNIQKSSENFFQFRFFTKVLKTYFVLKKKLNSKKNNFSVYRSY